MSVKHANAAAKQGSGPVARRQNGSAAHANRNAASAKQLVAPGAAALRSMRSIGSAQKSAGKSPSAPKAQSQSTPKIERGAQLEAEADHMARHVSTRKSGTRLLSPKQQGQERETGARDNAAKREPVRAAPSAGGDSLDAGTRTMMERQFGRSLSHIRIREDAKESHAAERRSMKAYTVGSDIVFAPGRYNPSTTEGQELLAHEIAHVIQQSGGEGAKTSRDLRPTLSATKRQVQSKVEVRPVGKGEASAFERRQELLDRMNHLSAGMQYVLAGREITYTILDASHLTPFDQRMRGFIDKPETVPLRLITSAGLVRDGNDPWKPLSVDSFGLGYLDVDDMRASDDNSFQLNLLHLLTERFAVSRYDQRIGTFTQRDSGEFDRAHAAGVAAETQLLRDKVGDPTIRFVFEEDRGDNVMVFGYRSREGYSIFHVLRSKGGGVMAGNVFVQTKDKRRLSLDDFIAERSAAAAARVPAAPPATTAVGAP